MPRGQRQFVAAGDTLVVPWQENGIPGLIVVGAFTGTIGLEVSNDGGTTWDTVQIQKVDGTAAAASLAAPGTARATGIVPGATGGLLRARAITLTAGTPQVIVTTGDS